MKKNVNILIARPIMTTRIPIRRSLNGTFMETNDILKCLQAGAVVYENLPNGEKMMLTKENYADDFSKNASNEETNTSPVASTNEKETSKPKSKPVPEQKAEIETPKDDEPKSAEIAPSSLDDYVSTTPATVTVTEPENDEVTTDVSPDENNDSVKSNEDTSSSITDTSTISEAVTEPENNEVATDVSTDENNNSTTQQPKKNGNRRKKNTNK